ncbi:MAG TPA: VWA domain-containing protein, partial [Terriglobales bacterium]|nr:VWA domain-containing protein [Terriglobales bacterium]
LFPSSVPGQAKPDAPPVFKASSSLVTVNVIVTDRFQQPVTGLTAKDFTVYEDGKKQTLRAFERHVSAPPAASGAPPLELPANQFTNYRERPRTGVINIVLFDMLNTPWEAQAYARAQLLAFLKTIPPGERVALFTLGTRLRQVRGITDDPAELAAVARNIRPSLTTETLSTDPPGTEPGANDGGFSGQDSASRFAQAIADEQGARNDYRVGLTVDAIGALARAVAGYPGRKNLIWLSAGFPLSVGPNVELPDPMRNVTNYQAQVNRMGIALASSQMAVYPIDVRGLVTAGFEAASRGAPFNPSRGSRNLSWLSANHDMMRSIAQTTGGEAFYNTNGVVEAMQKTIRRSESYYTLAYVPLNRVFNGRFRSIRVKTKDETHSLQYRRGYMALPERRLEGRVPLDLLFDAMHPGFPDSTMLLMKAQVLPTDDEHPKVRIDYAIVADQLTFVDIPGRGRTATVDFAAAAFDAKGDQVAIEMQRVEGTLRPEDMKLGFAAHQEIGLRPGTYTLKIGAIDIGSQKIGTIELPLVVPVTRHAGTLMTDPERKKK